MNLSGVDGGGHQAQLHHQRLGIIQPIRANWQPAFAVYQRTESGTYHAFGISVLTIDQGQVADSITFIDPALISRFNLPSKIEA